MILPSCVCLTLGHGWPRTSGDDPYDEMNIMLALMLAPHERG